MRAWSPARWWVAVASAAVLGVLVAVPTAVLPTPWFTRMTPVTWWSYPSLAATAVLGGLLVASYVHRAAGEQRPGARTWWGGLLSWFAVGCPVCNKLVVLALGYSGAVSWFAPLQPVLALASPVLLGWGLRARLRAERSCPAPAARAAAFRPPERPAPPRAATPLQSPR